MVTKRQADEAYEKGSPIITDEEYDKKFGKNATSEHLDINSPWVKMKHPDRFGGASLDKISVSYGKGFNFTDLYLWSSSFIPPYCCSYKYDGISVSLIYNNGVLEHAITKGAGNLGEDILRNVSKMKNARLNIDNFDGIIKAEIVIDHKTFDEYLKGNYSNPRNGAAGAARAYDGANAHHCTLKYYGIVPPNGKNYVLETEKFKSLNNFGFEDIVWKLAWKIEDVISFYEETLTKRSELNYDIDGIVVTVQMIDRQFKKINDERPRYSVALKLPYSEKKSVILDIVWQNGAKNRITPVAIINPIELGGAIVSRVTLKNLDEIKRLKISIGDEILVSRRGDVIPNIESNLTKHDESYKLEIPAMCPACGGKVSIELPYLFCRNSECFSKRLSDIKTWVAVIKDHFNYRGFADRRIEQLYEAGLIRVPSDLYTLGYCDIIHLPGIGDAVADDISGITDFTEIPFSIFLTGLNIEGINYKMAKLVSERYKTFDMFLKVLDRGAAAIFLQDIPGFGDFRALALTEGMESKKEIWQGLLKYVEIVPDEKPKSNKLSGLNFCITGTLSKPRDYFVELIEKNGGKFVNGVTSKTNYLVAGGKVGAGKSNAAQEYGTKIITEQELMEML